MKLTFQQAQKESDRLYASTSETSTALNGFIDKFPKGSLGLTPDHVKAMPEYKTLNKNYSIAFENLRTFNKDYTKTFAKELRDERNARRAAIMIQSMEKPIDVTPRPSPMKSK